MSEYPETQTQETILNVRGVLARHRLVEDLVRKQNLVELQRLLEQLDTEPTRTGTSLRDVLAFFPS